MTAPARKQRTDKQQPIQEVVQGQEWGTEAAAQEGEALGLETDVLLLVAEDLSAKTAEHNRAGGNSAA